MNLQRICADCECALTDLSTASFDVPDRLACLRDSHSQVPRVWETSLALPGRSDPVSAKLRHKLCLWLKTRTARADVGLLYCGSACRRRDLFQDGIWTQRAQRPVFCAS